MTDQDDAATIERLYTALDAGDGDTMASLYAPDAHFRDPAFGDLTGEEAGDMWRLLTRPPADVSVELRSHSAAEEHGKAHWIASYTFSRTGRDVVNDVEAAFRFKDGKIIEHIDEFSFFAWSRQALGAPGLLLGWTPFLPHAFRKKTRALLDEFRAERAGGGDAPAA